MNQLSDQNIVQQNKLPDSVQPLSDNKFSIPTLLTIFRVAVIPLLGAAYYILPPVHSAITVCSLFLVAAITDFLDGVIARKFNLKSKFGAFLDPVADKLMVMAVLIMLSSTPLHVGYLQGNPWIIPTLSIGIIGREISMSALREWASSLGPQAHAAVQVNSLGKYKTASQMISLIILLLLKDGSLPFLPEGVNQGLGNLGMLMLMVASALTLQSLVMYFRGVWKFL